MAHRTRAHDTTTKDRPAEVVTARQVHPDVWAEAMRAADGDARRIEVLSERAVVTHNQPRR